MSKYDGGAWPELRSVTADIDDLAKGLAPHFATVETLPNPTTDVIRQKLREFMTGRWDQKNERLLVYYAGHGFTDYNPNSRIYTGYITGRDTPACQGANCDDAIRNAIPFDEIDSLNRETRVLQVINLFDSCFSGLSVTRDPNNTTPTHYVEDQARDEIQKPIRYYITAGGPYEHVPADSPFASLILKGLGGEADFWKDGFLTGEELGFYLERNVPVYAKRPLHPMKSAIVEGTARLSSGQFMFLTGLTARAIPNTSAKPPGGVLHVLAIGVDNFGDKAGGLHLDYAAEDAHDVANALLESQKGSPGKASLYADVNVTYLPNDKADRAAILDALDAMAQSMATNEPGQDVAVILVSSHGEMIDGQFYLIPYGFDAGSKGKAIKSAVSASEFAEKVQALAEHGKVLLLLDACHSGAVGAQGWATDPDAKVLQDAMDLENVTVLTSSKKNELSKELPDWKHGALAQAFLDALAGAADSQGIVRLSALTDAMENEIQSLTKGRQHLGMHVNFSGDLFVASHY